MPQGQKISSLVRSAGSLSDLIGLITLGVDSTNQSTKILIGQLLQKTIQRSGAIFNIENEYPDNAPFTLGSATEHLESLVRQGSVVTPEMCNGIILEFYDYDAKVWRQYQFQETFSKDSDPARLRELSLWVELAITTNLNSKADLAYVNTELAKKANTATTYTKTQVDNLLLELAQEIDDDISRKADADSVFTKQEVTQKLNTKLDANQGEANKGKSLIVGPDGNITPGDAASDGNTINLGKPAEGYYTLATALVKVEAGKRKSGLCITYMIADGVWETKQYTPADISGWTTEANWADVTGGGRVEVDETLSNTSENPVQNKAIAQRIFDLENNAITEIDNSLDNTSTNPVQNAAVATAIEGLQNPTFDSDVEEVEDGSQVTLSQNGRQVAQFVVAGGGGGGSAQTSKITLNATVSANKVKEGGHSVLNWYYNHLNSEGVADGIAGDITVSVKRGAVVLHEETIAGVTPSEAAHSIILDPWLTTAGTIGVTIRANAIDNGVQQSKQFYVTVTVVQLSLTLNNATTLIGKAMQGGYTDGESILVGYTVKGSGSKEISMYIDGSTTPTTATVTKSGTTNGQFVIAASSLTPGRHTIQIVAENDNLFSESTYIDILKAGSSVPFIGLNFTRDDGYVFYTPTDLTPSLKATQYATSSFYYYVYDPAGTSAVVTEYRNGVLNQTFSVGRARQTYTSRYNEAGTVTERYVCGSTSYAFNIVVEPSTIDVQRATANLNFGLSATGRSNEESDPAKWTDGDVTTSFYGFDWKSSGWNGDALVMRNGAKIVINAYPFDQAVDPAASGKTIEMEFKVSNIIDSTADIISCISGGKGFHITGSKASMLTGSSASYTDEDGNEQTRLVGVEKTFAEDIDIKMAFVIGQRSQHRLMELYVNGTREKSDLYNTTDNFVQDTPVGITFDSTAADIELRNVYVYDCALTDDEEVDNWIVDRKTVNEMLAKYEENDVLENGLYDITKILAKGKGVVHFIRPKGLDEVNSANNKKTDFLTDVIYYSPFGPEWDLKIEGCNVRIQGTSSTKYPRKNYRIYLLKPSSVKVYRRDSNGNWVEDTAFTGYIFRDGDREAPLICLKSDYSDSSMTMNTGGAKLWEHLTRTLNLLTPPQLVDPNVRQAIDGFPVDVFCTDTEDPTNAVKYYGQYNFNHDKGKSKNIFGHVKITDEDNVVHNFGDSIALETLTNGNPLCLFQAAGSANSTALADQLDAQFDDGLEFNHPEDTVWGTPKSDQTAATTAQRTAVKRLFGWIYDCMASTAGVQAGTMTVANPDYGTPQGWSAASKAKWVCSKFKNELSQYFSVQHLLTYYVFTDYFMSVDQRAKNMLERTWDYLIWYITYYDGDCQLGKRNDSFLAYLYTLTRDFWDSEKSKYAFEGHDSNLWCLVLANFEEELKTAARNMRNVLTNDFVLNMLNEEQQGNWSARAYNKSGEFKYIIPATEGVTVIQDGVKTEGVKYPYIYALDGTNYSHRVHTILHRFALLDAKYGCDTFHGDNVEMYIVRENSDAAGTIKITSNAPYYFDWNYRNGSHNDPQQADTGDTVTLTFTGKISINDPVDLYGASCIEKLDLTGVAGSLNNGINLNKAKLIREINAASAIQRTQAWWFNFEQCTRLRLIDCTGHLGVKTGTSSSTEFNVANQTRLEVLRLGGTGVQSVEIAEGAPLYECVLPSTLTVLKLRYLAALQASGLTIQGYQNITTINFAACPHLDWVTLAEACPNLDRLRVEGVDMDDDGSILLSFKDLRGIDADGNAVPKCQLVGDVYLTRFLDDETLAAYREAYPSLNIHLPEYSTIVFDDTVSDTKNITNLENNTGYGTGEEFLPSGHFQLIRDNFIPVYGKLNEQGDFEAHPISKTNYRQLPDGTDYDYADVAGDGHDSFKLFPHCWIKGVNDYKNQKKYAFVSNNAQAPTSSAKTVRRKTLAQTLFSEGYAVSVNNITVGTSTMESAGVLAATNNVNTYITDIVDGMKQVRYPGMNNATIGACFLNAEGVIISKYNMAVTHAHFDFMNGDYIFLPIPEGATQFAFSCLSSVDQQTPIITVDSNKVEAIEPDVFDTDGNRINGWVEVNPFLVAIHQASVDALLRMRGLGGATVKTGTGTATTSAEWQYDNEGYPTNTPLNTMNYTCKDFQNLAFRRGAGYQDVDYEMSKMVALLVYGYTGDRDSSLRFGYGKSAGGATGYYDTGTFGGDADGLRESSNSGNGNKVLGLESWFGCTYEWMAHVAVNVISYKSALANRMVGKTGDPVDAVWHIYDPTTDTERTVQGTTETAGNIARVRHGRFCDVIPARLTGDTNYATHYADGAWITMSSCRVVGRSSYSAYAVGGVAYANANFASSVSYTYFGSRLAFRPPQGKKIILIDDEEE